MEQLMTEEEKFHLINIIQERKKNMATSSASAEPGGNLGGGLRTGGTVTMWGSMTSTRSEHGKGSSTSLKRSSQSTASSTGSSSRPLPRSIASPLMMLATTMLTSMATTTMDLCLDERDGVWEVACAPHSWLSEACERQGQRPRRINLEQGCDLYKPATWERMKQLRRLKKVMGEGIVTVILALTGDEAKSDTIRHLRGDNLGGLQLLSTEHNMRAHFL